VKISETMGRAIKKKKKKKNGLQEVITNNMGKNFKRKKNFYE